VSQRVDIKIPREPYPVHEGGAIRVIGPENTSDEFTAIWIGAGNMADFCFHLRTQEVHQLRDALTKALDPPADPRDFGSQEEA
jgi:hypothetical protein